jgi:NAD(P)H-hydrate repair Nnr-like enzyme with NAD(P)H-hydrate epimerase domain
MTRSGASVRQLQALDRHATSDYHIPVVLLMEHAAMAVAQACERPALHIAWYVLRGQAIMVGMV